MKNYVQFSDQTRMTKTKVFLDEDRLEASGPTNPTITVAINPQPIPPKNTTTSAGYTNPADTFSINPQPIPPKLISQFQNPIYLVAINPQPIPPKDDSKTSPNFDNPISLIAINPQPIPPAEDQTDRVVNP